MAQHIRQFVRALTRLAAPPEPPACGRAVCACMETRPELRDEEWEQDYTACYSVYQLYQRVKSKKDDGDYITNT